MMFYRNQVSEGELHIAGKREIANVHRI